MQNQKYLPDILPWLSLTMKEQELKRNFAHRKIFTLKNGIGYFEGIDDGPVIK